MGDLEGEDPQLRTISKAAGVVIVSVEYRLAPAHPYPAPFDDCVTAYYWALKNTAYLKTTPSQAFTFGTSAGGNLALSVALKVLDDGNGNTLKGVIAVVPVTVDPEVVPEHLKSKYTSYVEHAEHTVNTTKAMKMFFGECFAPKLEELRLILNRCISSRWKRSICFSVASQETQRPAKSLRGSCRSRYSTRRRQVTGEGTQQGRVSTS